MKQIPLPCIAVCSLFALQTFAQLPQQQTQPQPSPAAPKKHSISFEVKNIGSGGAAKISNAGLGSKTQTDASVPSYEVTVRNFSTQPDTVTMQWFIFSKSIDGRGTIRLHDSGDQPVNLDGGKTITVTFQPKPILRQTRDTTTTFVTRYTDGSQDTSSVSSRSRSGMKPAGWVVRLMADGQVIGYRVSEPALEDFGRYPQKLDTLK
jgi:hypothetical protein